MEVILCHCFWVMNPCLVCCGKKFTVYIINVVTWGGESWMLFCFAITCNHVLVIVLLLIGQTVQPWMLKMREAQEAFQQQSQLSHWIMNRWTPHSWCYNYIWMRVLQWHHRYSCENPESVYSTEVDGKEQLNPEYLKGNRCKYACAAQSSSYWVLCQHFFPTTYRSCPLPVRWPLM